EIPIFWIECSLNELAVVLRHAAVGKRGDRTEHAVRLVDELLVEGSDRWNPTNELLSDLGEGSGVVDVRVAEGHLEGARRRTDGLGSEARVHEGDLLAGQAAV